MVIKNYNELHSIKSPPSVWNGKRIKFVSQFKQNKSKLVGESKLKIEEFMKIRIINGIKISSKTHCMVSINTPEDRTNSHKIGRNILILNLAATCSCPAVPPNFFKPILKKTRKCEFCID